MEVLFPKTDVNQIIELIIDGDAKCLEVTMQMVDITGANLGYNLFVMESVLKNVLLEVTKIIFSNKKWLEQFIDTLSIEGKNISVIKFRDISLASLCQNMRNIDTLRDINTLRNRLHESIERGNKEEILIISQELDIEILKFMQKKLSYQECKSKKQDRDTVLLFYT